MVSLLLICAILFVIAVAVYLLTALSIEESLFASVCSIIILIALFGIYSLMNVAQIIIYGISILSVVYIGYSLLIKKRKVDFAGIFTPSVVLLVFAVLFYYLAVRNNVLHVRDEITAYAISVKRMLYSNEMENLGCVTAFSYFFTKLAGYNEGLIFTSKWLFMWVLMILPLHNTKWDKWYVVLIYGLLGFGVLTIINPEPTYLMDVSIGVMAGSLTAYLCVSLKKSNTVIIGLGLITLIMIKDMAGILFTLYVGMFMAVYGVILYLESGFKFNKKALINIITIAASLIIAFIIGNNTVGTPAVIADNFTSLKVVILLATALIFALGAIFAYKKFIHKKFSKRVNTIIIVALAFAAAAVVYKLTWMFVLSFEYSSQKDFIYMLTEYFSKQYFNIKLISLLGLLVIFTIVISLLALKKEYIKYAVSQMAVIAASVFSYAFIIAYIFTVQYSYMIDSMNGFERYVGSMVIMALVWAMGFVLAANQYWEKWKAQLICIGVFSSLIIRCYPVYGETMFNIYNVSTISIRDGLRPFAQMHADLINSNTPEDASILIVNQNNGENYSNADAEIWINYFIVPREISYAYASFSTDKQAASDDIETVYLNQEKFYNLIIQSDYVYVISTDEEFWESYGDYFPEAFDYDGGTLFEVVNDGETLLKEVAAN